MHVLLGPGVPVVVFMMLVKWYSRLRLGTVNR